MMDIKEISEFLPHRYPFLLVDRVVSVEPGDTIKGYKNVSVNEMFFNGHFPGNPVMPGGGLRACGGQRCGAVRMAGVW